MSKTLTGLVLYGINNIYTVEVSGREVRCRIKGKILGDEKDEYNPLAPSDQVLVELLDDDTGQGFILQRLPRRNSFQRWNKKGRRPQTLAANLDGVLFLTGATHEFFRPRFVDRGLVLAEWSHLPAAVVINKIDLGQDATLAERCRVWQNIGVPVIQVSALLGTGLEALVEFIQGKTLVLCGQSGVGKSTLLNRIIPKASQKTAELSRKYLKGIHSTTVGRLFRHLDFSLVDTPGVRELELWDIEPEGLSLFFHDFRPWSQHCAMTGCTHLHEPGCGVLEALDKGLIHPDRYESYVRLHEELAARRVYG